MTDPHRWLLALRFGVVNLVGFSLLGAAWLHGWVDMVVEADGSNLCFVIFGLFLVGQLVCGWKVWQTSRDINDAKRLMSLEGVPLRRRAVDYLLSLKDRDPGSRAVAAESLKLKLRTRIAVVRHIASTLVLLGLIGTVVGFIIALSGVDPDVAADVEAVGPMVSTLINGMSVALYTTLVGAIFNVWLMVCHRILDTGTVNLATELIELGERSTVQRTDG